jgi:hypothetical protein
MSPYLVVVVVVVVVVCCKELQPHEIIKLRAKADFNKSANQGYTCGKYTA